MDRGQTAAGQVRGDFVRQTVKDAGPVDPKEVNALGFLLGDKKAGPFKLEVEWIRVHRAGASE